MSITFDEYQQNAARTRAGDGDIILVALGLTGEAGEVADHIKKWRDHGHPLDRDKVILELGDLLWYLSLGADVLGTSLASIAQRNIDKLKARYPDGFTTERSLNRADAESAEAPPADGKETY